MQEFIIALKIKKTSHLPVKLVFFQKHLGVCLDGQLNFCEYLNKVNARILQKGKQKKLPNLQNDLPKAPLLIIKKSFKRSHVDYRNI